MTTSIAEKPKDENKIESDTFKPTGINIGNGCWGQVELYKDSGNREWAIKYFSPNEAAKKQMEERGWDEERVMREESVPLESAVHNVVPRLIERDKTGKMFVAMPYFREGDLSDRINNLGLESALQVGKDIATALKYTHERSGSNGTSDSNWIFSNSRKAHGDVKPSNILMANGKAYLNDFGSSTCITVNGNGSQRGPHGDLNYRAPEAFKENASPSTKADVWSLGSILFESIAKQGIYDEHPNLHELDPKKAQKIINKKIRQHIPKRKLRKFLKKCLAVNEYDRFYNGREALSSLEDAIENLDTKKAIWKTIRKWTIPLGLSAGFLGLASYHIATHEPQKLTIPEPSRVPGVLYKPGEDKTPNIEFEYEALDSLPAPTETGMLGGGITKNAKLCTDNRVVAYLAKTHGQVAMGLGALRGDYHTQAQFDSYVANTTSDERMSPFPSQYWAIIGKSIEAALSQGETKDGKIDLEDVMATTRVGIRTVDKAKRISGSLDYRDYRNAKDSNGEHIISERDRKFIDHWISQYHADLE